VATAWICVAIWRDAGTVVRRSTAHRAPIQGTVQFDVRHPSTRRIVRVSPPVVFRGLASVSLA
jgi:hypothetical protein